MLLLRLLGQGVRRRCDDGGDLRLWALLVMNDMLLLLVEGKVTTAAAACAADEIAITT